MKLFTWLSDLFSPGVFNDLNLEELSGALADSDVRRHWLIAVLEEIRTSNLRTHTALMEGRFSEKFALESGRLIGIDFAMRQILNSKTSIAMERSQNRTDDGLEGVAVKPVA